MHSSLLDIRVCDTTKNKVHVLAEYRVSHPHEVALQWNGAFCNDLNRNGTFCNDTPFHWLYDRYGTIVLIRYDCHLIGHHQEALYFNRWPDDGGRVIVFWFRDRDDAILFRLSQDG